MVMRSSTGTTLISVSLLQHQRYSILYRIHDTHHAMFARLYIQGLVVPVLRDATHMNYARIERGINELGVKVRTCTVRNIATVG
jgi:pyruvate/2-oxoglutarate dehydrogenase complex dihydrolipoamide acyltransferase (E2) component